MWYGRPSKVCNTACSNNDYYASAFGYAQYGLQTSMTLGNGVPETRIYNSSLQAMYIQAGPSGSLFNQFTNYGWPNSGIVWEQETNDHLFYYNYDGLNRLTTTTMMAGAAGGYAYQSDEAYAYDRFSNRAVTRSGSLPGLTGETPSNVSWYNTANNRIGSPSHMMGGENVTAVPGRTMYRHRWAKSANGRAAVGRSAGVLLR